MVLDNKDNKVIAHVYETLQIISKAFMHSYRFYNGGYYSPFYLPIDLPKVSGAYYIPKPKIYIRRSPRTKNISYLEIIAQLPQRSSTDKQPEYIIIMINVSISKLFRLQKFMERLQSVNKRIKKSRQIIGDKHYFIYFIHGKTTIGVENKIKRIYAVLRNKGANMVIRSLRYDKVDTIIQDLRKYIESRIEKILDPSKYRRSNGYIFSYPKRFIEYLLTLDALLLNQRNIAEYIADIQHNSVEYPITRYIDLLNTIKNNISNKNNKNIKIRTSTKPSLYI